MKSSLIIISWYALLCTGCFEDKHFYEIDLQEKIDTMTMMMYGPDTAEIKLDFLVGQKIRYRLSTFGGYYDDSWFEFDIKTDTLELEVLEQRGDTFLIKESFTPFSHLMLNPDVDYYEKKEESEYLNYWVIRNDSLILTKAPGTAPDSHRDNNSHLLGRCCLYMRDFRKHETKIVGFKTRVPFSVKDKEAFTRDYTLNAHHYDRLNIFINDEPMWRDDYGNTTVYGQGHGIVRGSRVEGWFRSAGYVWDRL